MSLSTDTVSLKNMIKITNKYLEIKNDRSIFRKLKTKYKII